MGNTANQFPMVVGRGGGAWVLRLGTRSALKLIKSYTELRDGAKRK